MFEHLPKALSILGRHGLDTRSTLLRGEIHRRPGGFEEMQHKNRSDHRRDEVDEPWAKVGISLSFDTNANEAFMI
jgi:hypothetical protein